MNSGGGVLWALFRAAVGMACYVAFVYQSLWVGDFGYGAFWGVCAIMWMPSTPQP